jgi:ABC-type transport system involved in multi-copper enzyme maturation permease subunit
MSTSTYLAQAQKNLKEQPWSLYAGQVGVLVRNEVSRNLFSRRRIWVYFLAFIPVVFLLLRNTISRGQFEGSYIQDQTEGLALLIQIYYVRIGIFFACMGVFTWLFRGEIVQRTLHYQFLAPVRREVLVIGKFLAGCIVAIVLFEIAVLASFYLFYSRFGAAGRSYMFEGPGLSQLGSYLLVTALACVGYGSLFLALSLLFKNPIVPGIILMGWEIISPIFPSWAQHLSVTFYLKHLCPITLPTDGPMALFTVVAEPVAPFVAVFGLCCLALAVLVLSCFLIRRVEIMYTAE